jgi:hypothetical protein
VPSSTKPPACSMRASSVEVDGRWSVDRSVALPQRRASQILLASSKDANAVHLNARWCKIRVGDVEGNI